MLLLALSFLYHFYYTLWDIVMLVIFTYMAILAEKWSKAYILLTYIQAGAYEPLTQTLVTAISHLHSAWSIWTINSSDG